MTKTYHVVTPADTARASIPIGQSMPDTEVLLLDERGAPVADGAVGEIHLRTPYRSLGYHDQPEATRQAFVPGPDGATVYRTGDFGRLLPDGVLEFLGRKDHQVKVGGVRVELGGVEAALREHPEVSDAAVTVVDDESTPYLAAYVELSGELPQDLREHLRDRLPDAAVPAVCVPLAELPRTITGTVDRQALPAPVRTQAPADSARVAPRTATERTVAGIWAAVLPGGAADVRQDFFAAGGTSLLVIELLARLADAFGVSVPLREFLAGPTVETLAALVERALLTADTPDLLGSLT